MKKYKTFGISILISLVALVGCNNNDAALMDGIEKANLNRYSYSQKNFELPLASESGYKFYKPTISNMLINPQNEYEIFVYTQTVKNKYIKKAKKELSKKLNKNGTLLQGWQEIRVWKYTKDGSGSFEKSAVGKNALCDVDLSQTKVELNYSENGDLFCMIHGVKNGETNSTCYEDIYKLDGDVWKKIGQYSFVEKEVYTQDKRNDTYRTYVDDKGVCTMLSRNGIVKKYNSSTNKTFDQKTIVSSVCSAAMKNGFGYVVDRSSDSLVVFDLDTLEQTEEIELPKLEKKEIPQVDVDNDGNIFLITNSGLFKVASGCESFDKLTSLATIGGHNTENVIFASFCAVGDKEMYAIFCDLASEEPMTARYVKIENM